MVNMKDIEKLAEDYMLEHDSKFSELKPYLLSEFEWNVDPLKQSYFPRSIKVHSKFSRASSKGRWKRL